MENMTDASTPSSQPEQLRRLEYTHLDRKEIRLVRIYKNEQGTGLNASLITCPLDEAPPFYALSYVWGDAGETELVEFDRNSYKYVTPNLYLALRNFEQSYGQQLLWVDQICINQTDKQEKSDQVAMMGAIYQSASTTIIWFGEDTNGDAKLTFDWMQSLFIFAKRLFANIVDLDVEGGSVFDDGRILSQLDPQISNTLTSDIERGLRAFLRFPWFSRLWVVQEAVLSRNAFLTWGQHTFGWKHFVCLFKPLAASRALGSVSAQPDEPIWFDEIFLTAWRRNFFVNLGFDFLFSNNHKHPERRNGHSSNELAYCLTQSCFLECKEERDKIFAILRLCYDSPDISISYTRGTKQILRDIAVHLLTKEKKETCRCQGVDCWYNKIVVFVQCNKETKQEGFPSWIPRWEPARIQASHFGIEVSGAHAGYNPSKHRPWDIQVCPEPDHIKIRGIVWDRVTVLGSTPISTLEQRGCLSALEEIASDSEPLREAEVLSQKCFSYNGASGRLEALLRTLCFGEYSPKVSERNRIPSSREHSDLLSRSFNMYKKISHLAAEILRTEAQDSPKATQLKAFMETEDYKRSSFQLLTRYSTAKRNRVLFTTEQGYIGLGDMGFAQGDNICIFFGAAVPTITRLQPDGTHRFIGFCYVHGIMDGEVMDAGDSSEGYITLS